MIEMLVNISPETWAKLFLGLGVGGLYGLAFFLLQIRLSFLTTIDFVDHFRGMLARMAMLLLVVMAFCFMLMP